MISPQMVINYLDMKPGASSCSLARLRAAGLMPLCFLSHLLETHLSNKINYKSRPPHQDPARIARIRQEERVSFTKDDPAILELRFFLF